MAAAVVATARTLTPEGVVGIAETGVNTLNSALDLFDKLQDKIIPWKKFQQVIDEIKKSKDQYSKDAAVLVGQVETLLLNAQDSHLTSIRNVIGWCKASAPLLQTYKELFADTTDKETALAQVELLNEVLKNGVATMTEAMDNLEKSKTSFNGAQGELTTLNAQLEKDLSKDSDYYNDLIDNKRVEAYAGAAAGVLFGPVGLLISYGVAAGVVEGDIIPKMEKAFEETKKFYKDLQKTVQETKSKMDEAKSVLDDEINAINQIHSDITSTQSFASIWSKVPKVMYKKLEKSTDTLIADCNKYVQAHE